MKQNVTTTYLFVSMPTPLGDQRTGVHIARHYFYDKLQKRPRGHLIRYMWHTEPWDYEIGDGYAMSDSMPELDPEPQPVPPSPSLLPSHGTTMIILPDWTKKKGTRDYACMSLAARTPISPKRCVTCRSQI